MPPRRTSLSASRSGHAAMVWSVGPSRSRGGTGGKRGISGDRRERPLRRPCVFRGSPPVRAGRRGGASHAERRSTCLALLIARAPAVVPKRDIHECLWPGTFVSDATPARAGEGTTAGVGRRPPGHLIRTAHRIGYAFAGAIQPARRSNEASAAEAGSGGERRFPLREGVNVIGRDPDAAVVARRRRRLPTSRPRHPRQRRASLEDLGSKNGTLIRDRPVRGRVVLRDADRIQLATELLVFHTTVKGRSTVTQAGRTRASDVRPKP